MDIDLHVNQQILIGANQLELILSVPPDMIQLDSEIIPLSGKVKCIEGTEENNSIRQLLDINWIRNPSEDFPFTLKFEFDSGTGYGARIWESSPKVSDSSSLVLGLLEYVRKLKSALESRDFERLVPYFFYKHAELSKCFGFPISELRNDDKELYEQMFADPDWRISDYNEKNLVIEYWAGNRIVSLQRSNGQELLRTPRLGTLDIIFSLPLQLCLIDGQWQLIG